MNMLLSAEKEVKTAFLKCLEAYFGQRDLEQTIRLFDQQIAGFGTARDELAKGLEEVSRMCERHLVRAPERVTYELRRCYVHCLSACCGVAYALVDISAVSGQRQFQYDGLRVSTVFHKTDGAWLLAHMHFSLPAAVLDQDQPSSGREPEDCAGLPPLQVDEKTVRLDAALQEIQFLVTKDKLTGLCNRLKINEHLSREINRSQRYLTPLSLILLDVDHFKAINDTYGHQRGDQVLAALALLLQQRLRKTDILGRWDGQEFLLLCPETNLQEAASLADALRVAVAKHDFAMPGQCSISLGVTSYAHGDSDQSLVNRADKALQTAKSGGRNLVVCRSARIIS